MPTTEQVPEDWLDRQLVDPATRNAYVTEFCRLHVSGDIDAGSLVRAMRKVIAAEEREEEEEARR